MKRSKIQLSLRHLKIVVMLIIVVFSNDIMCQKRHLRRPANPKSLGYSKSLQSASLYSSNNNISMNDDQKTIIFNSQQKLFKIKCNVWRGEDSSCFFNHKNLLGCWLPCIQLILLNQNQFGCRKFSSSLVVVDGKNKRLPGANDIYQFL